MPRYEVMVAQMMMAYVWWLENLSAVISFVTGPVSRPVILKFPAIFFRFRIRGLVSVAALFRRYILASPFLKALGLLSVLGCLKDHLTVSHLKPSKPFLLRNLQYHDLLGSSKSLSSHNPDYYPSKYP
jgi:hypothetical protein